MKKKDIAKQVGFWTTVVVAPGGGLLLVYVLLNNKRLQSTIRSNFDRVKKVVRRDV